MNYNKSSRKGVNDYHPQTKLLKGNVFTGVSVSHSVHRRVPDVNITHDELGYGNPPPPTTYG